MVCVSVGVCRNGGDGGWCGGDGKERVEGLVGRGVGDGLDG